MGGRPGHDIGAVQMKVVVLYDTYHWYDNVHHMKQPQMKSIPHRLGTEWHYSTGKDARYILYMIW